MENWRGRGRRLRFAIWNEAVTVARDRADFFFVNLYLLYLGSYEINII